MIHQAHSKWAHSHPDGDSSSAVIGLVADRFGLDPERVNLSTRLFQDLGVDGSEAVRFFADFKKRFGADLTQLYRHWGYHFGPQRHAVVIGLLALSAVLLAPAVLLLLGPSLMWAGTALIIAAGIGAAALHQWPSPDEPMPVTVNDLVRAAETKQWTVAYPG